VSEWILATVQAEHTRHFGSDGLPVTIGGGRGNDIELAGIRGAVQIGCLDQVFFIQPGRDTENLRLGGEQVRGSKRLSDGDVIALDSARLICSLRGSQLTVSIEAQITAGDTAPPDFDALAKSGAAEVEIAPVAFQPRGAAKSPSRSLQVSPGMAATVTALVALAAIGWFAFSAKSVGFNVVPMADEVRLPDTLIKFSLGDRFLLRPGRHRVTATLAGYYPLDKLVSIGASADQTIQLELIKLPGLISFATDSGVSATVRVDGESIGTTPIANAEIVHGSHQIEFVANRHLPEVFELDVEGLNVKQSIVAALTPSWAPVSLISEPAGATVNVDGNFAGTTPVELELTAGERSLEITLRGYNAWQDRIMVIADTAQALPAVVLSPADGRVELASTPTDASVSVNGEYRGRTPMNLRLRPGQTHSISISKPGYEPSNQQMSVAADSGRSVSVDLVALYGEVAVESAPVGAEIYVDDRLVGTTPSRLELLSVPHVVEVKAEGYAPDRREITPRPGYSQALAFDLVALNQASGSGFANTIRTSLGQELRLIPAGRFTMGSSRREEGRRSNEVLREVEISSAFYLGVREVTNAEYRKFQADYSSGNFASEPLDGDNQPVVRISWQEAAEFLNYLSVLDGLQPVYIESQQGLQTFRPLRSGYRFPTEAEWAWAARAAGRDAVTAYAWGSDPRPTADRIANLADLSAVEILPTTLVTYSDGFQVTAPAGSFAANPVGIFDMDGNVAEWVQDYYEIVSLPSGDVVVDPLGPDRGRFHVARGPSWRSATMTDLRLAFRITGVDLREDIGFRIARSLSNADTAARRSNAQ
jgi:formylglycine-generating enzyme required for sulfatase activity